QPVVVVGLGHAVEAPGGIECEVDGVELDVADRMDQRGTAFGREWRALLDIRRRHAPWPLGPARHTGLVTRRAQRLPAAAVLSRGGAERARGRHLVIGVGEAQRGQRAKAGVHPYNSRFALPETL